MSAHVETPEAAEEAAMMESLRTVVVKPHDATDDTQLTLKVGDIVYVLEQDETGWWGGHKEDEDHTGWFPGSCVAEEPQQTSVSGTGHGAGIAADSASAFCSIASLAAPTEGGTMGSLSAPPESCHAEDALTTAHTALETDQPSPVRRSLAVASPQRASFEGMRHADVVIPGTPAVDPDASSLAMNSESLVEENTRLRQANVDLDEKLKEWQRQSDADRRKSMALEAEAQREKKQREELEAKLKAESQAKMERSSECGTLREQLEKAKRSCQAQDEAREHMKRLYEDRLRESEAEIETLKETGRKSLASERQRADALEEQLRSCRKELEASASAPRGHCASPLPAEAASNASVVLEKGHLAAAAVGDPRRRLFSSTVSDAEAPSEPSFCLSDGGRSRGAGGAGSSPAPASAGAQSWRTTTAGSPSTAGRKPPPAASSPSRLGHAQSAGSLGAASPAQAPQPRVAPAGAAMRRCNSSGPGATLGAEAPNTGHVAEKLSFFQQHVERHVQQQTPRRELSKGRSAVAAPSYFGYGRMTPRQDGAVVPMNATAAPAPPLPKARQGSRPPAPARSGGGGEGLPPTGQGRGATERVPIPPVGRRGLPDPGDDSDPGEWQEVPEEICLGMSPIRRCVA